MTHWGQLKIAAIFLGTLMCVAVTGIVVRNSLLSGAVTAIKENDRAGAVARLRPLGALGDSKAQLLLVSIYAYGWGGGRDDSAAIRWLKRGSGETELAAKELGIALAFARGDGGAGLDPQASSRWLRRSAEAGNAEAARLLSMTPQTAPAEMPY